MTENFWKRVGSAPITQKAPHVMSRYPFFSLLVPMEGTPQKGSQQHKGQENR